ncbi:MAG: caspase family protein [Rhodopseudomonas sp.]|nr:caspase family protein [Rhodopseudomonas sp.]
MIGPIAAVAAGLLLALLATAAVADSGNRVALVFGNSAYSQVPRLPNPATDAAAIAAMLKKAGFDVMAKQDASASEMRKMLRDFSDKMRNADVAVVFYAGHGIEVDGTNYVLPVDAKLERDIDVEDEAVSLDRIVRILEPAKRLRLVILDACRDNPFANTMKRSLSRGVERGLAKVEPTSPNTLIAYAAKAGSTASDGDGPDSPFTTALLKQLPVPGQDLRKSLGYVRDEVMKTTGNKQEPYVYGSLGGDDVVLVPGHATPAAVPATITALDPNSPLRRDYELAAQINTRAGWDAFLKTYSTGFYADLARAARGKLDAAAPQPVASAAPADSRNLSGADAHDTATAPGAGFDKFVGRSFKLTFVFAQDEVSPRPGIKRGNRELVVFVKSASEISTRLTSVYDDSSKNQSHFGFGALGEVKKGIQVTFADRKLWPIVTISNFRLKSTIALDGNTCRGTVDFELSPGSDHFELHRLGTGETMNVRAVTAERLSCWVSNGDAVGQPPATTAKPK